jgi:phosphatidylethanolamine/phosphatidyl-N-methylethanolamine N-methyltransferase
VSVVMRAETVAGAYDRWAPVYDLVFGGVFKSGRAQTAQAANRIGGRILEAGVGTGISLPLYRKDCRLTGIDLSPSMLEKARERARSKGLFNIDGLEVMNVEDLRFPDESFDVVIAQYVVTAVPDPERALDEFCRVLKPGGEIIIATRISAEDGLRDRIEKGLMPLTSRLGWRTEFPWTRYEAWAATRPELRLIEHRPLPPFGHFSLVRYGK